MGYAKRMINADASRDMPRAAIARPIRLRLAATLGLVAALGALLALWARFGEGVYAQTILNGLIACF